MSKPEDTDMKIIAIDPGRTTGYCYARIENEQLDYYPFQEMDDVNDLWNRLERFDPRYIIIEDFEFRKRSRAGLDLYPVQCIGVANLYVIRAQLRAMKCNIYTQKAMQGKSYYTDNVLKQLGLYKRGIPHGMDASRHLLQWCMFGAGNKHIGQQSTEDFATIVDWWR